MKSSSIVRVKFFYVTILLVFFLLACVLFNIQIIKGDSYEQNARSQYIAPSKNVFNRGSIFFTTKENKKISAATLKSGYILAINPSVLNDEEDAFSRLIKIVDIDKDDFIKRAVKSGDPYEEILSKVDDSKAKQIRDLNILGVLLVPTRWRYYPAEESASHLLGFVGSNGDTISGRYGIERYYNNILSRLDPKLYVNFFAEVFSNISSTIMHANNNREGDVVTNIEPTVQGVLEKKIKEIESDWKTESAGGLVIDPRTGAVYAIANTPRFNPNSFNEVKNSSVFVNPIVESVFEMGSIIKPLTIAAGIDAGTITSKTEYKDNGYVTLDNKTIWNHDRVARGNVSMQEVINQSLNTGAVFVMQKLGKERFRDYMISFGISESTGIDLPNETSGLVDNLNSNREIEYATASFGQGIAMTPIEAARAMSSLANNGKLINPHVAKKIEYTIGGGYDISGDGEQTQVISPETAEDVTRMLVRAVDEALLDGSISLKNHSVAAKTGTAQIANPNGGGYYGDRFLHSFFGYFPAYDPKFLIFLYAVYPKGAKYASDTLAVPFMDTTKFLINYYNIPPDR